MDLEPGQQGLFTGYDPSNFPEEPILQPGQRFVCAAATSLSAFTVFPVDERGWVYSWQGETVFDTEFLPLALPYVPLKHLPKPYGEGSVDYDGS